MRLDWHARNERSRAFWIHGMLAFAALFAFLVSRYAPPRFLATPSLHHSSVSAVSDHNSRPRFEFNGSQWSAPVGGFLPLPPRAVSVPVTAFSLLFPSFQTKGIPYNRPPPAC